MSVKTFELACPCCGASITLDAESGMVLSHVAPKKPMRSFDEAVDEVKQGKARAEARFSKALEERSHHSELLDKKFRKALEKAGDDPTPPKNPFDQD